MEPIHFLLSLMSQLSTCKCGHTNALNQREAPTRDPTILKRAVQQKRTKCLRQRRWCGVQSSVSLHSEALKVLWGKGVCGPQDYQGPGYGTGESVPARHSD